MTNRTDDDPGRSAPAPRHGGAGLYLHVPFCAHRCHYCDFNTYAGKDELIPRYFAALRRELVGVARAGPARVAPSGAVPDDAPWPVFTSVFVGGGTPTLAPAAELVAVLAAARAELPLAADVEITVEANPETVAVDQMRDLRAAGVDRISMGAQSFAPHVLAALGRWHDAERPLRAVEQVRAAGIERVNLDLIYGTPGERDEDWRASLTTALSTGVDHVSAYALTVEPSTEYARRIRRGEAAAPDDDVQAARMAVADEVLSAAGLARYELSNWARPGQECRHNLLYWRDGDWLGIGAGAHGHWQGRRWWTVRSPERFVEQALAGGSTVTGEEVPSARERRTERLLLGLRTVEGVDPAAVAPLDDAVVARMVAAGLLERADRRLRLTSAGFTMANAVTVELL